MGVRGTAKHHAHLARHLSETGFAHFAAVPHHRGP
jgi:hypothetical protein